MGKLTVLRHRRSILTLFASAAFAVVFVGLSMPHSFAATNASTNSLKVSPVRTDISVAQGQSQAVTVTVSNITNTPISIHPIENDFIAGNETGTPSLILDENTFAPTHSLKRFMLPLKDFTIAANSSSQINVTVAVPKSAQAGGYFGAIRFAPSSANDSSQVNLNISVASLILLTVPGPTVEQLNLTDFTLDQNGKPSNGLLTTPKNISVSARFENTGNLQEGPFGTIDVQRGNNIIYKADFNNKTPKDVVLPDSARRWNIPLEKISGFGHYKITANFSYGSNNTTIDVTKSFWVIPLPLVITVVAIIVVILALVFGIRAFLKSYKKRILNQTAGHGKK